MLLEVSYEDLLKTYPEAVQEVLAEIRKRKHKGDPPESFTWMFEWAVRIDGLLFVDVISGKAIAASPKSVEEQVQDYAKRCMVFVQATKSRCCATSSRLSEVPKEILDLHRKLVEKAFTEKARIEALSPEEREKELQENLRQLRKDPGFAELIVRATTRTEN